MDQEEIVVAVAQDAKMCRDIRLLHTAMVATNISEHKFPIAAIIAKGSRILAIGINKTKSHPQQTNPYTSQPGLSIHAELAAVISLGKGRAYGTTIYIARRLHTGAPALAKPCRVCREVIREAGIKKIVYTTNNGYEIERV